MNYHDEQYRDFSSSSDVCFIPQDVAAKAYRAKQRGRARANLEAFCLEWHGCDPDGNGGDREAAQEEFDELANALGLLHDASYAYCQQCKQQMPLHVLMHTRSYSRAGYCSMRCQRLGNLVAGPAARGKVLSHPEQFAAEVVRLYVEVGLSTRQIAVELGWSPQFIRKTLATAGIPLRGVITP